MQKNIFLEIEYLGTNYFGFQIQANRAGQLTVQGAIERALFKLFDKKIRIIASGRTDRGVHAKAQVINFSVDTPIPPQSIKKVLNSLLPLDIRVKKIKIVPLEFHSRFWAKLKVYRYIILNQKDPSVFWHNFSWHFSDELNLALMRKAAKKIMGEKDFSLFAKEAKKYLNCKRDLKRISISKKSNFIYINLEANGFLRQMARNIVFLLTEVGSCRVNFKDLDSILSGRKKMVKKPAPPQGLYLYRVRY